MSTIKAEDLAKEIDKVLKEWENVTEDAAVKGLAVTAEKAVNKLHTASPAGSGEWGSWDKYNASWAVKHETGSAKKATTMVIHNQKHYQLTHLLENGHALQNGGRARAFPHIAPVAEEAEKELLENIKQYITK